MKKIIMSSLIALTFLAIVPKTVNASTKQAMLVGRNYGTGEINTTIDVTNANTHLSSGYTIQKSTNPTISWMKGSNAGTNRMESYVLFFSGHGAANYMHFYNSDSSNSDYDFYITTGNNSSSTVGLSSYNMNKVRLAVFAGCNTGSGTSNITKSAYTKGAKASIGWIPVILASSHTQWLNRFWQRAGSFYVLSAALSYADSYTYTDSGVKSYNHYGNWATTLNSGLLVLNNSNNDINKISDKRNNMVSIDVSKMDDEQLLLEVEKYILNNLNDKFSLKDYEIDKTERADKNIFDIKLVINGDIKTKLGYTVFVENGQITNIFDNMKGINNKEINTKIVKDFNYEKNIIDANNGIDFLHFEMLSQKSYKYYDDDEKQLYFVVSTTLKNKIDSTVYVNEYKVEI